MSETDFEDSLIIQIEADNPNYLELLPLTKEELLLILKCALPNNDSFELRKIFKNIKIRPWLLIKEINGKNFGEEFKDCKYLPLFELCRYNYQRPIAPECKRLLEIICQFMRYKAKKLVQEMVSWHRDNSKGTHDLVDFIFYDISFIEKCPELIERITPNIWKELNEKEKSKFSNVSLCYFQKQISSLQDTTLKNELEKYFSNNIITNIGSVRIDYFYENIKNVFYKRDDLVEPLMEKTENADIEICIRVIKLLISIETEKSFYRVFELFNKISNDVDVFSMLMYLKCDGYKDVLTERRKLQINELVKKEILQQEEANKLIEMAENEEKNYYAWSDEDIKKCLSGANLEKLHVNLEPEFMVRLFEMSISSVIKHKPTEQFGQIFLTQQYPFVMPIFNKSYTDRPSIWAKHLIKIAEEWQGNEDILIRICIALGHLREPLGGKVPVSLGKIADRQENEGIKKKLLTYRNLFNRNNFNKGHHKSPSERVRHCKDELIEGINASSLEAR